MWPPRAWVRAFANPFPLLLTVALFSTPLLTGVATAAEKKASEKQPVPKQPTSRTKPGTPAPSPNADEDEDEDDSDCFLDCLFGIFSGSGSSEQTTVVAPAPAAVTAGRPSWAVGDRGVTINAGAPAGSITLWSGPGGAESGHQPIGSIPPGQRVEVIETHSLAAGLWLRLRDPQFADTIGWLASSHLITLTEAAALEEARPDQVEPAATPDPFARPLRFTAMLELGGTVPGPSELGTEYADGTLHVSAFALWGLGAGFFAGPSLGFLSSTGNPQTDYLTAATFEVTSNSRLETFHVSAELGQILPWMGRRAWFHWSAAPGLYFVREGADIVVYLQSDGSEVDRRRDTVERWSFGGSVLLGAGGFIGEKASLGLMVRGYMMSWNGESEKSVTTDFLYEPLYGVDIGVVIGYTKR